MAPWSVLMNGSPWALWGLRQCVKRSCYPYYRPERFPVQSAGAGPVAEAARPRFTE